MKLKNGKEETKTPLYVDLTPDRASFCRGLDPFNALIKRHRSTVLPNKGWSDFLLSCCVSHPFLGQQLSEAEIARGRLPSLFWCEQCPPIFRRYRCFVNYFDSLLFWNKLLSHSRENASDECKIRVDDIWLSQDSKGPSMYQLCICLHSGLKEKSRTFP